MERNRLELGIDGGAAAIFGAAVSFSATLLGAGMAGAFTGALTFAAMFGALRLVPAKPRSLPNFDVAPLEPAEEPGKVPELLLPKAEILDACDLERAADAIGELLLEDMLAPPEPDSRVVQLFGGAALPTPGELKASIDRHLERQGPQPLPDSARALSEALAHLRRSLR